MTSSYDAGTAARSTERADWAGQRAMAWVIDDAPVPIDLAWTLVVIARRCDDDGKGSYQSIATLAAKTGKSEKQARRDVAKLVELGLIRLGDQSLPERNGVPDGRRPTVYDVALDLKGPKPPRQSKNPTGLSKGDSTPPMDGTPPMQGSPPMDGYPTPPMHAPATPPMDGSQRTLLEKSNEQPSLSAREPIASAVAVPTQRTEREDQKDSQNTEPTGIYKLLAKHGAVGDAADYVRACIDTEHNVIGAGFYYAADKNGSLAELIADGLQRYRDDPAASVPIVCGACNGEGETGDYLNRRPCDCLWFTDPARIRPWFVKQLDFFPPCEHGFNGGDQEAPNGWRYCGACRGPGWVDLNVQPRTEKRRIVSTADRRVAEGQALYERYKAEEDRNERLPQNFLADSRAPGRNYSERL